jgi:hypothetical protein
MAELADALDLGSSAVKGVQVQILFPAPINLSLFTSTQNEIECGAAGASPAQIAATHRERFMGGAALQRCV